MSTFEMIPCKVFIQLSKSQVISHNTMMSINLCEFDTLTCDMLINNCTVKGGACFC